MPSTRIDVKPEILEWVAANAQNLSVHWQQQLNAWLTGDKKPTVKQLQGMSLSAKVPFGYFFLNQVPHEDYPLLKYRTVDNVEIEKPSRDLIDVMTDMAMKQEWLSDYWQKQGISQNWFNGAAQRVQNLSTLTAQQQAAKILQHLELPAGWNEGPKRRNRFKELCTRVSAMNVTVMQDSCVRGNTHRPLNEAEFRAFAMTDDYAPIIFINRQDGYRAQLFSLVHELVHLWYGQSELFNFDFKATTMVRRPVTEQVINQISEEILFDQPTFERLWGEFVNEPTPVRVKHVAEKLGTSPLSAGIRAVHLQLISQQVVDNLKQQLQSEYQQYKQQQRAQAGGPSIYAVRATRIDHAFVAAVVRSAQAGDTSYPDAFDLVGVKNGAGFDQLVAAIKESDSHG